ncbi:DUF4159 domain-containing protein [Woodsholea maritima]|uniref:DUF4159 domain-containing protein n=1 Tax=Woodsholea maritima TaxID=240237 RepID=UPI0003729598|nr:DUF4159 domain-containing protein [Woodsholea maritima]
MFALGPLGFTAPLALMGLLSLPILYWLLRATPPAPKDVVFAPLALLRQIAPTKQNPKSAPLWLVIFRLLLAALIIIALARPVWRPEAELAGDAPLLIVIDNDWAGAQNWARISREARARLEGAALSGRQAALIWTAPNRQARDLRFVDPRDALDELAAMTPKSWTSQRRLNSDDLTALFEGPNAPRRADIYWISNGLSQDDDAERAFASALSAHGPLHLIQPEAIHAPLGILPPLPRPEGLEVQIVRADSRQAQSGAVLALAEDGRALARQGFSFTAGETRTQITLTLPLDLRNRIRQIRLDGIASAGAVQIMDDAWRRPRLGLITPEGGDDSQPLLSDLYYAEEAFSLFGEVTQADLTTLLESQPSALIMVDAARSEDERLSAYVEAGGVLIRFAGPRLAARGDNLLPTPLRTGGRLLGGALAWDEPQSLAPFSDDSPFAGLVLPADVRITHQVLAEPGPAMEARVWARLEDGTPLVTADRRGEGWIVLFHISAGPEWSNLPLSGLFPQMLRRISALAQSGASAPSGDGAWHITQMLNGFGQLTDPHADLNPIPASLFAKTTPSATTPPGLYELGSAQSALNVLPVRAQLSPLARNLPGALYENLDGVESVRLIGPLLILAGLMLALDGLIALTFGGHLPKLAKFVPGASAALLVATLLLPVSHDAKAQELSEDYVLDRALEVRLAYVQTGVDDIDRMSEAGLSGLSFELTRRSAIEPGEPRGINIETDPILFYPLLYWPVLRDAPALSPETAHKITAYLQTGGLIVFDTRDAGQSLGVNEPHPGLAPILDAIDVPALSRIPADHVLGRTFYLLSEYPGRLSGGEVWVEADPDGSSRDGTSGVVIGGADWAGAWAVDTRGRALAAVEGGEYQREIAYRFGVNLAMYALTGNYKADQVHVPAILERLGEQP